MSAFKDLAALKRLTAAECHRWTSLTTHRVREYSWGDFGREKKEAVVVELCLGAVIGEKGFGVWLRAWPLCVET